MPEFKEVIKDGKRRIVEVEPSRPSNERDEEFGIASRLRVIAETLAVVSVFAIILSVTFQTSDLMRQDVVQASTPVKPVRKLLGAVQIAIAEPACKKMQTFKEWAEAAARNDFSKSIPAAPECLDIPVRTKVEATGKTETIQKFGEPALYREIKFNGVIRWIDDPSLEPVTPKPELSTKARALIADMKRMYDEMERVRYMPAFHRCMFGTCSSIKQAFHTTWLDRAWGSDELRPIYRELMSKGVTVTAVDIKMMAKDYANTKGKGNKFTRQRDMELRTLFSEY